MKILYVCGTYCPSYGGAEISMHTLLKQLKKNYGVKILVLTDKKYTKNKEKGSYDGIKLEGALHKEREKKLIKLIAKFKPDLIVTQLMWSDFALKISKLMHIPTILRVCKIPFKLDIGKNSEYSPTGIIAVSKSVKKYIRNNWKRESKIIFPAIDFKKVLIPKEYKNKKEYITMFNPLIRKGGDIFRDLAARFSNKKFAVVYGWSCLKNSPKDNEFSNRLVKRISESLGVEFTGKKPKYADLKRCNNIKVFKPTERVWKIYAKTKLLLIPSQWEEAFGRVAIEGMVNGIPVIASKVGGLKEAVGEGGILIENFNDIKYWEKEIVRFDNSHYYKRFSEKGIKWVKGKYSLNKIISDTFNFFSRTTVNK